MKTIQIEEIAPRLLLFGGVYSNLQALESIKEIALTHRFLPSQVICNGDVVGYCAQPEESIQFVKDWGIHCILGNVEEQLRNGEEDCGCDFEEGTRCDLFSRQWYPYAQKQISTDSLQWMQKLPHHLKFKMGNKTGVVVHGAFSQISKFIFKSTPWAVKQEEFDQSEADIIIAGHAGLPFSEEQNGKMWINPGVIGMPANDGSSSVWYAILSVEKGKISVQHHTFNYDYHLANQLMVKNQLPQEYAKTLLTGVWDNCEILPEAETNMQGQKINLQPNFLQ